MKRLGSVLSAMILVAGLCGCAGSMEHSKRDSDAEVVLRLAEIHTEGYPTTLSDEKFAELVGEKSNGRIKIKVYSDGVLGDETSIIEQLQYGGIDFGRVSTAPLAESSKQLSVLMLPFLYKDDVHMWKVLNSDLGQALLESISSTGLVGLAWYDAGARSFYCTKEIQSIEDMKNLRFRVQDSKLMLSMVEALGGIPSKMPQGELYNAIKSGVLDGAENNLPIYESYIQYDVAPYYILDEHTRVPDILAGSKVSLEKLSREDQELIRTCAKETQEYERTQWKMREESAKVIVKGQGAKIIELSPEVIERFRSACQPLYKEYGAQYSDVIEQIKEMQE